MHKYNLNNITIFLNVLFLIVLTVYFFISFIKNDQIEIVKKNIDKEIITEDKVKVKNFNNIEIEDVALPEIEKKDLDKTIKKNIKFAHDQKLEVLKALEISQAKKIDNIKIQPLKYEKQSIRNAYSKIDPVKKSKNFNRENINFFNIQPLKYEKQKKINYPGKIDAIKKLKITKPKKMIFVKKENIKLNKQNNFKDKKYDFNKLKNLGNTVLENNRSFRLEFLWPVNTFHHDKIYTILDQCLQSETVLIDNNNSIYNLNGEIKRYTLDKEFSRIIRVPTHVHSQIEKNKINEIRTKFLTNSSGKHLRLYKKHIDAYIIGFYLNLAKRNQIKLKNIKNITGKYNIINDQLYLENLMINAINFNDKILLSSLGKTCSI